jgi:hypothetical protein
MKASSKFLYVAKVFILSRKNLLFLCIVLNIYSDKWWWDLRFLTSWESKMWTPLEKSNNEDQTKHWCKSLRWKIFWSFFPISFVFIFCQEFIINLFCRNKLIIILPSVSSNSVLSHTLLLLKQFFVKKQVSVFENIHNTCSQN